MSTSKPSDLTNINLMKNLSYAGFGIVFLFILILSLSFGGDAEKTLVALFLVTYVFFVGTFLTYLDAENKIDVSGDEQGMVTGTVVVFCILILLCVGYALFVDKGPGNRLRSRKDKNKDHEQYLFIRCSSNISYLWFPDIVSSYVWYLYGCCFPGIRFQRRN